MSKEVLVVDDSELDLKFIEKTLQANGFIVTTCQSASQAITLIDKHSLQFDIMLIDYQMPNTNGIELCKQIRSLNLDISPFILIITSDDLESTEIEALRAGADDFILKPFNVNRFLARMMVAQRMIRYQKKILELAHTDPLTGLPNRRHGLGLAKLHLSYLNRNTALNACLVMCDLDHFKQINDNYGHSVGDEVLATVSSALQDCLRDYENVVRMGGEEFLLFLDCDTEQLEIILTRLMQEIVIPRSYGSSDKISVSMSFGCLQLTRSLRQQALNKLITATDALLYEAKGAGRNRAVISDDEGSLHQLIFDSHSAT